MLPIPLLALLSLLLSQSAVLAAEATSPVQAPMVVVEVDQGTEDLVNGRLVRRLIALELADTRIDSTALEPGTVETLYYRLRLDGDGQLEVELWSLGTFYGSRKVSVRSRGRQLLARHIALAAAELAQRLNRMRRLKSLWHEREEEETRQRADAEARRRRLERWVLRSGIEASWVQKGDVLLAGPVLGFQLNRPNRGRLELSFSLLSGDARELSSSGRAEWLGVGLSPAYRIDSLSLELGFNVSAAVLVFPRVGSIEGVPGAQQTWSARAGAHIRYQPRLSEKLRLDIGPAAGTLLRSIPLTDASGSAKQIGGLWAGLWLGLLLDT